MLIKKIILYLTVLVICFTVWNLIISYGVQKLPLIYHDTEIGYYYDPGKTITNGTEGFSKLVIDDFGYNNDTFKLNKDKTRIIILGDSHTEAFQVSRENNFCSLLSFNLNNEVEILNFGISANSAADYIATINRLSHDYNPDKIIIQITANDFTIDATTNTKEYYISKTKPFELHYNKNKKNSFSDKIKTILRSNKYIPAIIPYTFKRIQKLFTLKSPKISDNIETNSSLINLNAELIKWEVNEISKQFHDITFLYLPYTPSIIGDYSEDVIIKDIIIDESNKFNIDVIDLTKSFDLLYETKSILPRGFSNTRPGIGHLNKYGHEVVALELSTYLKSSWGEK